MDRIIYIRCILHTKRVWILQPEAPRGTHLQSVDSATRPDNRQRCTIAHKLHPGSACGNIPQVHHIWTGLYTYGAYCTHIVCHSVANWTNCTHIVLCTHVALVLYSVHFVHRVATRSISTTHSMHLDNMCTIICTLCILFSTLSVTTHTALYMCTFVYYSVHYCTIHAQFTIFDAVTTCALSNATKCYTAIFSTLCAPHVHTLPDTIQYTLSACIYHMCINSGQVYIHTVHVASNMCTNTRIRWPRQTVNKDGLWYAVVAGVAPNKVSPCILYGTLSVPDVPQYGCHVVPLVAESTLGSHLLKKPDTKQRRFPSAHQLPNKDGQKHVKWAPMDRLIYIRCI